jgi:hypothetical protein
MLPLFFCYGGEAVSAIILTSQANRLGNVPNAQITAAAKTLTHTLRNSRARTIHASMMTQENCMVDLNRWQTSPFYKSHREAETAMAIRRAVEFVLLRFRDVDPYQIENHADGCSAELVISDSGRLVNAETAFARDCPKCAFTYLVMSDLVDEGLIAHQDSAFRAIQLGGDVIEYGYPIDSLDEADQELARIAIQSHHDLAKQRLINESHRQEMHMQAARRASDDSHRIGH